MEIIYNNEKKSNGAKVRKWFLTVWKMDINFREIWEDFSDIIKGMGGQLEIGEKTGKQHFQLYIHMINPCKLSKIRNLLSLGKGENSGAIFTQKGTNNQVLDYVFKSKTAVNGTKFQYGNMCVQGCRTDLETIKRAIDNGKSLKYIRNNFYSQYIRYRKSFKAHRQAYLKENSYEFRNVSTRCLIGDSRTGKTRDALYIKSEDGKWIYNKNVYKLDHSNSSNVWFDDYDGEKILLINDFYGNMIPYGQLLNLLEGHHTRLEVKGGKTYALWDEVIITSNRRPEYWYRNIEYSEALNNRLITGGIFLYEKNKDPRRLTEYETAPVGDGKEGAVAPFRSTSGTKCQRVILEPLTHYTKSDKYKVIDFCKTGISVMKDEMRNKTEIGTSTFSFT